MRSSPVRLGDLVDGPLAVVDVVQRENGEAARERAHGERVRFHAPLSRDLRTVCGLSRRGRHCRSSSVTRSQTVRYQRYY